MMQHYDDDPVGRIDLTDLDLQYAQGVGTPGGAVTVTLALVSLVYCSRNTICGTCNFGTSGCC